MSDARLLSSWSRRSRREAAFWFDRLYHIGGLSFARCLDIVSLSDRGEPILDETSTPSPPKRQDDRQKPSGCEHCSDNAPIWRCGWRHRKPSNKHDPAQLLRSAAEGYNSVPQTVWRSVMNSQSKRYVRRFVEAQIQLLHHNAQGQHAQLSTAPAGERKGDTGSWRSHSSLKPYADLSTRMQHLLECLLREVHRIRTEDPLLTDIFSLDRENRGFYQCSKKSRDVNVHQFAHAQDTCFAVSQLAAGGGLFRYPGEEESLFLRSLLRLRRVFLSEEAADESRLLAMQRVPLMAFEEEGDSYALHSGMPEDAPCFEAVHLGVHQQMWLLFASDPAFTVFLKQLDSRNGILSGRDVDVDCSQLHCPTDLVADACVVFRRLFWLRFRDRLSQACDALMEIGITTTACPTHSLSQGVRQAWGDGDCQCPRNAAIHEACGSLWRLFAAVIPEVVGDPSLLSCARKRAGVLVPWVPHSARGLPVSSHDLLANHTSQQATDGARALIAAVRAVCGSSTVNIASVLSYVIAHGRALVIQKWFRGVRVRQKLRRDKIQRIGEVISHICNTRRVDMLNDLRSLASAQETHQLRRIVNWWRSQRKVQRVRRLARVWGQRYPGLRAPPGLELAQAVVRGWLTRRRLVAWKRSAGQRVYWDGCARPDAVRVAVLERARRSRRWQRRVHLQRRAQKLETKGIVTWDCCAAECATVREEASRLKRRFHDQFSKFARRLRKYYISEKKLSSQWVETKARDGQVSWRNMHTGVAVTTHPHQTMLAEVLEREERRAVGQLEESLATVQDYAGALRANEASFRAELMREIATNYRTIFT